MNNQIGLTTEEAKTLQEKFGKNELTKQKKENFFLKILEILSEPMFLLLIAASIIYFILGEPRDGLIMLVFVCGVISIDVFQQFKTDKTLKALKELSAPTVRVIRDGVEANINSADLVPGDIMLINEGVKISADGLILKCNDLCVDESSLTGEAVGVWKTPNNNNSQPNGDYWRKDYCYASTLVTQGTGMLLVDKIGVETEYGKIGKNVAEAPDMPTPLQKQTRQLVKTCSIIAIILFALVGLFTFLNLPDHKFLDRIIESVLAGITLAMAMIPEEFPVILTVFLGVGAWRLAKKSSLVRKLPSVETLGAVSVLCVDKTGTITQNKMTLTESFSLLENEKDVIEIMGMGCETDTYDPMEKAMLTYCEKIGFSQEYLFRGELVSEFPFTNETKMMGHIWKIENEIIIAAKGSPEKILTICELSDTQRQQAEQKIVEMSQKGLRVIAVAKQMVDDEKNIPSTIFDCKLELCGLVGFCDPPRETVEKDIAVCVKAGVRVVMITGDNGITASSIAKQIGMQNSDDIITGDQLNEMTDEQLREHVKTVSIFSRVVPEHKMRIVNAFKQNGEIVAMTGDGVNDAPALKNADIGIAMGKKGSQVSREAADLILLDDNFSTIVDTIKDGRRIYDNIKKAVGYVFTIHIPIAFASLLAPMLGFSPATLMLLPLHVVLLELVIDPTCSVVLERQPAEKDVMQRKPRNPKQPLLTPSIMIKSILQGLAVFAASFGIYFYTLLNNLHSATTARTMGIAVIFISNVFLVFVNSSRYEFVGKTFLKLIKDKVIWAICLLTATGLGIMVYSPLNKALKLAPLSKSQLLMVIGLSFVAVFWYEIVKLVKRQAQK